MHLADDDLRARLNERYRPQRFEDVLGQSGAVARLARRARDRIGEITLFHGPLGTGKTTLARIYAKALQCKARGKDASPCGHCSDCEAFENNQAWHVLHAGRVKIEQIRDEIDGLRFSPYPFSWNILFFDEAHMLSRAAMDAIMVVLERIPTNAAVILATSEIERIPADLRARCEEFEITRLSDELLATHIKSICQREHISLEQSALDIILYHAQGSAREAIKAVERLQEGVTSAAVRELYNLDFVEALSDYLQSALAGKSLAEQAVSIDRWRGVPEEKRQAVETLLGYLYATEVERLYRPNPVMAMMPSASRVSIVASIDNRASSRGMARFDYWRQLVKFWEPGASPQTQAQFDVRLRGFADLLSPGSVSAKPEAIAPGRRRQRVGRRSGETSAYLTHRDVYRLWDAAAFLTQITGTTLNGMLELNIQGAPEQAGHVASRYANELRMILHKRQPDSAREMQWLVVHESPSPDCQLLRIALSLPRDLSIEAERWTDERFFPKECSGGLKGGWTVRFKHPQQERFRLEIQSDILRKLSRGLAPELSWRGHKVHRLAALLQIASRDLRPAGHIGRAKRVRVSAGISESAIRRLIDERLGPILPLKDGLWDALLPGWEFREHENREFTMKRRAKELAELEANNHLAPEATSGIKNERRLTWEAAVLFRERLHDIRKPDVQW